MTELQFKPDRYILESEREGSSLFGTGVRKFFTIAVICILGFFLAIFVSLSVVVSFLRLHPFRVPSVSMCPTVCMNERLLASMDAYRTKPPARGDVIMFSYKGGPLYIKRVVGISGDIVSPGPDNSVLVNRLPLKPIKVCGKPGLGEVSLSESSPFAATTVPRGSFFVLGDNLDHSLDSRFPEFGLVTINQIKAKPLFLYWSPAISRLGCPIQ